MKAPQKAIVDFLTSHPIGALSTQNKNGKPELTTVYFLVDPDLRCHVVTRVNTRKYKNSLHNQHGALLSYSETELTSVEVSGRLEVVHDTIEVVKVFERFESVVAPRRADYWIPPVSQLKAGLYVIITLIPSKILYRRYGSPERGKKKMTEVVLRRKKKVLELQKVNQ